MRNHILTILIIAFGTISFSLSAQDSTKPGSVKELVAGKTFVFRPQSAMPMGGGARQLTGGFELKMSRDKLVSYLPYFGRAYSAPLDPSRGGLDFTSKSFDYEVTDRRKGGWDIVIKPRDVSDIQQLIFTISESGSANLQVTSTNRQPISFTGNVVAR